MLLKLFRIIILFIYLFIYLYFISRNNNQQQLIKIIFSFVQLVIIYNLQTRYKITSKIDEA